MFYHPRCFHYLCIFWTEALKLPDLFFFNFPKVKVILLLCCSQLQAVRGHTTKLGLYCPTHLSSCGWTARDQSVLSAADCPWRVISCRRPGAQQQQPQCLLRNLLQLRQSDHHRWVSFVKPRPLLSVWSKGSLLILSSVVSICGQSSILQTLLQISISAQVSSVLKCQV